MIATSAKVDEWDYGIKCFFHILFIVLGLVRIEYLLYDWL
jgi:hypothetical protein